MEAFGDTGSDFHIEKTAGAERIGLRHVKLLRYF